MTLAEPDRCQAARITRRPPIRRVQCIKRRGHPGRHEGVLEDSTRNRSTVVWAGIEVVK